MKRKIRKAGETGENRLRAMCDGLSPQKRFVVVMTLLTTFASMAIYMAVSSVYGVDRPEMEVEHIKQVKFNQPNMFTDSINALKIKEYDSE